MALFNKNNKRTIKPQTVEVVKTTTTTSTSLGLEADENRDLRYLAQEVQS